MKKSVIYLALMLMTVCANAQTWSFNGVVLDKNTGEPVEFATVVLESTAQWAVADAEGRFSIGKVQSGKNVVSVSCLGFVTDTREITISRNIDNYTIHLAEDNLTLESVVVTAQEKENTATTSRMIDKTAIDHVQMMNVTDISSLLPGGVTSNPELTADQQFNIRAGGHGTVERGSASFGTAVEVDGVRLSNNASFGEFSSTGSGAKGVNTNNIASSNVESIEVITGVPSVEYGDMTSGVVKINTRKGKTPLIITASTNPRTKQVSASKGFSLGDTRRGASAGVINANIEYTKAISDRMSPYTGYDRKQLSLIYSNTFDRGAFTDTPLQFSFGVTGNLGGRNTSADPDTFLDTFSNKKDNSLRGNISFNWLLSKRWITNLELNASLVYSDRLSRIRTNYSSSSGTVSMHGREEGYFIAESYETNPYAAIIMIPRGYWFNTMCIDDRPLNYKVALKANWARQWGPVNNKVKAGADWSGDGNFGTGQYSEDFATAPSFREYRYDLLPFMNNLAVYVEDNIMIPFGESRLNIIAGLRNDNTFVKGSVYDKTSTLSPRFNLKYTVFSPKGRRGKTIRELSFRASYGLAVKLPSFSVLFPAPSYRDIPAFVPVTASDGSYYPAYYISPRRMQYNPELKWQRSRQSEIGMEIDIDGYRLSLAAYYNRTMDAYRMSSGYDPFSYTYTSTQALQQHCTIPADNRSYEIDRLTGEVTVHDKTGTMESQTVPYVKKNGLTNRTYASNDENPISRYGLEWIIDFRRIETLNTSIRLDGSYYGYRYIDSNMEAYSPYSTTGSDGEPYKYVGFYYGGKGTRNGEEAQSLKTNLTVTTNIPKIRMIISLKFQTTLLRSNRYLSERADGSARSMVISDRNDILSTTGASIYDGNSFTVLYPDYYTTASDPETHRDYEEDLRWARENDPQMYSDLSKLAVLTNYVWHFGKDSYTPYFSANISVTKEIGDIASVSFYANNFFNNHGRVKSSKTGEYHSLSGSTTFIPGFYYGLSLRLKF